MRPTTGVARAGHGRFKIQGTLGAGGMGIVLAAHDPDLQRAVALKILHPESFGEDSRDRLAREARLMAQLAHPNVVTVYEVGKIDDRVYIAMELVDGTTLRGWLAEQPRAWREIVRMFVEAGRGLVAAHDHGLVHRDFKPDNVLVGRDGRPRVTDFGLASPFGDGAPSTSAGGGALAVSATAGTPAYMAPEQWGGEASDPRTDQFAFCVALWEALHGARPFAGATIVELREAVRRGEVSSSGSRRVPRWLDAALRRGLAPDPAARWPDLASLLACLARRLQRRWWLAALGGAVAGASLAAMALVAAGGGDAGTPCAGVDAPFHAMWSADERARIARGFAATGGPSAAATWARLVPIVDDWGARWGAMRREACEATAVRHEQSPALLDLRMACLEDRRRELGALLAVFASATPDITPVAINALGRMEPIARCADAAALSRVAPPPAAIAPRVTTLKREVEAVAAAAQVNRTGYLDRAQQATAAAAALGYAPLEAEALFALGTVHDVEGTYEDAVRTFEAAALAADRCGDDRLRTRAWIEASGVAAWSLRRGADALRLRDLAAAALGRLQDPGTLGILLHKHAAEAHFALGHADDALREIDAALALVQDTSAPVLRAEVMNFQGIVLGEAQRFADSAAAFRQALALYERALGDDDPRVAATLDNLAVLLIMDRRGDYAEVDRLQARAIAIKERVWGPRIRASPTR